MALVLGRANRSLMKEMLELDDQVWQSRVEKTGSRPSPASFGQLWAHLEGDRWTSSITSDLECTWMHAKITDMRGKTALITRWFLKQQVEGMPDTASVTLVDYRTTAMHAGIIFASTAFDVVQADLEVISMKPQIKAPVDFDIIQQTHAELIAHVALDG